MTSLKHPRSTVWIVSIGAGLTAAAGSVVTLVLPDIGREFSATPSQSAWLVTSFLLALMVMLPLAGRVADAHGYRWTYLCGFGLFGLSSVACAASHGVVDLSLSRAFQGIAAALVVAASPALVVQSAADGWRGRALGWMTAATYGGLAVGPVLGGLLVRWGGWRATFLACAVVSQIIVSFASRTACAEPSRETPAARPSFAGAAVAGFLLLPAVWLLACLGPRHATAAAVVGCTLVGLVCAGGLLRARIASGPTVGAQVARLCEPAMLSAMVAHSASAGSLLLISFGLRQGQHVSVMGTAIALACYAAGLAISSGLSGRASDSIDPRMLSTLGLVAMALGLLALLAFWPSSHLWLTAAGLFATGAGMGLFATANATVVVGEAPQGRRGSPSSWLSVSKNLGMCAGVSIAAAFLTAGAQSAEVGGWGQASDHALQRGFGAAAALALLAAGLSAVRSWDRPRTRPLSLWAGWGATQKAGGSADLEPPRAREVQFPLGG
jgi:MFS family permease